MTISALLRRARRARGTTPRMPSDDSKRILFTVRHDPRRFPAALWDRFKTATAAQDRLWIDVLRELIEGYVERSETKGKPDGD